MKVFQCQFDWLALSLSSPEHSLEKQTRQHRCWKQERCGGYKNNTVNKTNTTNNHSTCVQCVMSCPQLVDQVVWQYLLSQMYDLHQIMPFTTFFQHYLPLQAVWHSKYYESFHLRKSNTLITMIILDDHCNNLDKQSLRHRGLTRKWKSTSVDMLTIVTLVLDFILKYESQCYCEHS